MDKSKKVRNLLIGGGLAVAAVVTAALLFPPFHDQFVWKYISGPLVADALNQATATYRGVTAHRGYTFVSITVYALVLLYSLVVISRLFDRLDVEVNEKLVVSLVPFMVFGGLLRVVEDAALAPYPWNALLISPVIYFSLLVLGFLLLTSSIYTEKRGWVESYHSAVRWSGGASAGLLFLLLVYFLNPSPGMEKILLLSLVPIGAVAGGLAVQEALSRFRPVTFLDSFVGRIAAASQVLDGAVTAVIVSFLGGAEKLPLSSFIIEKFHPAAFPVVKLGIILAFLSMVEKEEADSMTALAFAVLIAVGLGPATRNLTRALLGV